MKKLSKDKILEKNKEYSENFIQPSADLSLPEYMKDIFNNNNVKNFIDLGCGDGIVISAVKNKYPKIKISGIDISPRRINSLKKRFPRDNFYVKDVCGTKLKQQYEFVHSSQVIEHVPFDKEMVKEMSRLLTDNGVLFCSSVIKKPWAIYKYRNNGRFVLGPTHEREYKDKKQFLNLFKKDFKLIKSWQIPVSRDILGFHIIIPGYFLVFGIWKKRN
jgi:2-polyprenyl-3-methyl-5-hydroxy-6-metoxy-1,4-benzoquinol methylase